MKISHVSTMALSQSTRLALMKAQAQLTDAQKEAATGRYADVGAGLGFRTGQTVSMRNDYARLATIRDTNAVAETRLKVTQSVLDGLADDAQSFMTALIGVRDSQNGPEVIVEEAKSRLAALISGMSTASMACTYSPGSIRIWRHCRNISGRRSLLAASPSRIRSWRHLA